MSDDTLIQFPSGSSEDEPALLTPLRKQCDLCGQRFGAQAKFCPFDGERLADAGPDSSARELVQDPLLGVIVHERYRIERVLGTGGMGTVYEATHIVLVRRMALKVLRTELAGQGDLSARFLREARAAAAIEHPNVVRISDFGTLPTGQAYFVMELLSGTSLRALVSAGPLEPDRVASIAHQVADGLSAAHRAGIVHRDLKPDNIQIDPQAGDFVKVLDFGLARVAGTSRLTKEGVVFGTPQYMSPEQATGEHVDHRSDVYALGVMMYEMLTGRVPFEADTYMGVLTKHLRTPPVPPRVVLGERDLGGLEPIVLRAMHKSPEHRFSNMVELMTAIEQRGAARVERRVVSALPPAAPRAAQPSDEDVETEVALARSGVPRRGKWPWSRGVPGWFVPAALGAAVAFVGAAWFLRTVPGARARPEAPVSGVGQPLVVAPPVVAPLTVDPLVQALPDLSGNMAAAPLASAFRDASSSRFLEPAKEQAAHVVTAPAAPSASTRRVDNALIMPPANAAKKASESPPSPAPSASAPEAAEAAPPRRSRLAADIIDPWAEEARNPPVAPSALP